MKKPKAYMVATAHLDTVWNWTLEDTVKKYLRETLDRNFELIEKYPSYCFNFEGAYRYDLIKEYYPEDFERLRRCVAEGRWRVTGSSWENGDVITPAPETLMRNVLYGNRFFEREFGKKSSDIFLPDCFGFPATLPSIMRHMGLRSFSSQKLTWNNGEAGYRVPFHTGIWRGIDGSEVVASLDPGPYVQSLERAPSRDRELFELLSSLPGGKDLRYYGTGDQGGAPTEDSVRFVEEAVGDPEGLVETVSAYAAQLADELTEEERRALPRTADELLMIYHGVGSYTSVAPAKRFHRSNEIKADMAERGAVFSSWLGAREYPKKTLEKAWRDFIRHEFHDDLTGTSVQRAYRETFHDDVIVNNVLDGEIAASLSLLAANVDTAEGDGLKLVVFNPAACARRDLAEAALDFPGGAPAAVAVFDADGNEVPSAVAARDGNRLTVRFLAALPSVGYALFRVLPAGEPYRNASLRAGADFLENERLLVRVDENGDVSSIFDKENGAELLRAPLRLEILSNSFRGYGSWEIGYDDLTAPPRGIVSGPCRKEIAEQNGCRVALRVERVFGTSRFTQILSLDAGGDRLDVRNDVNWTESCSLLKAAFELDFESELVRYDAGLGSVERGDRTPLKYEVPVGKWASLYDRDRDYSVTILNDCKHGMDKSKNVLRLTLIHTPANRFMDETRQDLQDFGQNLFSFAIFGGRGDFRAVGAERAGTLYHVPPVACLTGSHEGILPSSYSFFSQDGENVAVRALKMAEDGDEIVVRLAESGGEETRASFAFGPGIVSAREINGYEEPVGPAQVEAGRVPFTLSPFEPKSFAVRLSPPAAAAKKPAYTPLSLEGSFVFSSRNASRGLWGLDEGRTTFPRELLEKDFRAAGIPFSLEEKDGEFLCMIPEGGELALPRETGVLHLIAARRDEDGRYTLLADRRPVSFGVECFRDDIGGWDQIGSGHFGFIREDRVALSASHTHDRSGDRVYGRFSWYLYSLRLPEGTEKIVFPKDPGMMIAAVTAERGGEKARLVTDIALHKKEKKPRVLAAGSNPGGGLRMPGEPIFLICGGDRAGEVVWKASDGSEYRGMSVAFDMPDRDLEVLASIKPYAKKLPAPVRALADTMAEDGHGAERLTDGRRDTLWRSATDGAAEILLDLGARRRFSHLVLFHTGAAEKDQTLNAFDYAVDYLADGVWTPLAKADGNILPVTAHDFPEIRAEFLRIRFLTPTHNGNDRRAGLAAAECYADADYGEETGKDSVTAYDLADGLPAAAVLFEGPCHAGGRIEFPRTVSVLAWLVSGAESAELTLTGTDGAPLLTDRGRDVSEKNTVFRRVVETPARGASVGALSPGKEARLTVFGRSFSLAPLKKYKAAECGGTRSPSAEKLPGGAMRIGVAEGQGHDLFGFSAAVPSGHITLAMRLRIPEEELALLPDETRLFLFCPRFPADEQEGTAVTAGDFRAAPADREGCRVLSDSFLNRTEGLMEGRITNFRAATLEVLDFTFYSGRP